MATAPAVRFPPDPPTRMRSNAGFAFLHFCIIYSIRAPAGKQQERQRYSLLASPPPRPRR